MSTISQNPGINPFLCVRQRNEIAPHNVIRRRVIRRLVKRAVKNLLARWDNDLSIKSVLQRQRRQTAAHSNHNVIAITSPFESCFYLTLWKQKKKTRNHFYSLCWGKHHALACGLLPSWCAIKKMTLLLSHTEKHGFNLFSFLLSWMKYGVVFDEYSRWMHMGITAASATKTTVTMTSATLNVARLYEHFKKLISIFLLWNSN